MGPHGSTLSVLASILGAILLSTNFLLAEANVFIDFVAAEGPVPVGGYLQITTLLLNNVTALPPFEPYPFANLALTVTCNDALIILPSATLRSPGCTNPVSVPPYPVGTPVGGPYPGCDPNPLGLSDLSDDPFYINPSVSADGHTAFWINMDLAGHEVGSVREPTGRYFIGLVTKYEPILCLATVEPSNISSQGIQYVLPNPVYGTTGASRNYLKEGLVFTNIIPPPPPPPGAPPGTAVTPSQPGGYNTGVPTSTTTLVVIVIFIPIPVNGPPCSPGTVSSTSITNSTALISNTTRCNTTEIRTVTNTTTCVPGGADRLVNTTTTTLVTCLPIEPPAPVFNVTLAPNGTLAPNRTLAPNGTLAPNNTLPPNATLVYAPTPTPSNLTSGVPISTTLPPGITTGPPVPTTAVPVSTTAAPVPTTAAPFPTTAAPFPTTAVPVPTTAAPVPTTAAPVPTTAVPVSTTAAPISTTAGGTTTTAPTPLPTL